MNQTLTVEQRKTKIRDFESVITDLEQNELFADAKPLKDVVEEEKKMLENIVIN